LLDVTEELSSRNTGQRVPDECRSVAVQFEVWDSLELLNAGLGVKFLGRHWGRDEKERREWEERGGGE
jgi:hypothetical protein